MTTYPYQIQIGRWLVRVVSLSGNFGDQALVIHLSFGRCHLLRRSPWFPRPFLLSALRLSTRAGTSLFGSPISGAAISGRAFARRTISGRPRSISTLAFVHAVGLYLCCLLDWRGHNSESAAKALCCQEVTPKEFKMEEWKRLDDLKREIKHR